MVRLPLPLHSAVTRLDEEEAQVARVGGDAPRDAVRHGEPADLARVLRPVVVDAAVDLVVGRAGLGRARDGQRREGRRVERQQERGWTGTGAT